MRERMVRKHGRLDARLGGLDQALKIDPVLGLADFSETCRCCRE